MNGKSRFRYELQPILLRRQWDLDALKLELNEINASLTRLTAERSAMKRESDALEKEWRERSLVSENMTVERFSSVLYYLNHLAKNIADQDARIEQEERARVSIIDQIMVAQRSLDAIEQHRDEAYDRFQKQLVNMEFKLADDHWSTLQINMEHHDHQF